MLSMGQGQMCGELNCCQIARRARQRYTAVQADGQNPLLGHHSIAARDSSTLAENVHATGRTIFIYFLARIDWIHFCVAIKYSSISKQVLPRFGVQLFCDKSQKDVESQNTNTYFESLRISYDQIKWIATFCNMEYEYHQAWLSNLLQSMNTLNVIASKTSQRNNKIQLR